MERILFINGCVRGQESRTWQLAKTFLEAMKENAKEPYEYEQLNLAEMDFQPLKGAFFVERQRLLEENQRQHPRFRYAHQFAEADRIILAAPFWDLSVPAIVKLYIENISLDGITFGCNEQGMYGMCRAKELLYFTTRGDFYGQGPMEQGAKYIEALCQMFGIPKFRCIYAEGIDARPKEAEKIMEKALLEAKAAGIHYWEDVAL